MIITRINTVADESLEQKYDSSKPNLVTVSKLGSQIIGNSRFDIPPSVLKRTIMIMKMYAIDIEICLFKNMLIKGVTMRAIFINPAE